MLAAIAVGIRIVLCNVGGDRCMGEFFFFFCSYSFLVYYFLFLCSFVWPFFQFFVFPLNFFRFGLCYVMLAAIAVSFPSFFCSYSFLMSYFLFHVCLYGPFFSSFVFSLIFFRFRILQANV
ncbi:hypothetical protein COOONC_27590 [Cooperia oncophora]